MSRYSLNVTTEHRREYAMDLLRRAEIGERGFSVTFRRNKRSLDQNALMWELLGRVSEQVEWYGRHLRADDWKDMFTASLRKADVVPGIEPGTFVPLGMRTSEMTVEEMSNLIELIYAFCAERGVDVGDIREAA